jgi:hypothetical protein
MDQKEFNRRRQNGWNPESPENILCYRQGEEIPDVVSDDIVVGYHWSEDEISDIQDCGETLDAPGEENAFGGHGSQRTDEYGEGYIFTHRDSLEALLLWTYMDCGHMYRIEGRAFDRENAGLVSGGSLDQIERVFLLEHVISCTKISREELEQEPNLFQRLNVK